MNNKQLLTYLFRLYVGYPPKESGRLFIVNDCYEANEDNTVDYFKNWIHICYLDRNRISNWGAHVQYLNSEYKG